MYTTQVHTGTQTEFGLSHNPPVDLCHAVFSTFLPFQTPILAPPPINSIHPHPTPFHAPIYPAFHWRCPRSALLLGGSCSLGRCPSGKTTEKPGLGILISLPKRCYAVTGLLPKPESDSCPVEHAGCKETKYQTRSPRFIYS